MSLKECSLRHSQMGDGVKKKKKTRGILCKRNGATLTETADARIEKPFTGNSFSLLLILCLFIWREERSSFTLANHSLMKSTQCHSIGLVCDFKTAQTTPEIPQFASSSNMFCSLAFLRYLLSAVFIHHFERHQPNPIKK